ncbi:MAG: hypothetical protein P1U65_14580 [Minwuia sp.]|nr:hypothetical protein [Minwuia sp.]
MADWPDRIFEALQGADVRQIAYVPDAGHKRLIERARADGDMHAVSLTTEMEGPAVLAGAWLGGQRGALLMQSSGVGNCPNMLSTTQTCRFPLLMLVTMRGEFGEFNPWQLSMGQAAAPMLEMMGTRIFRLDDADDAGTVTAAAAAMAFEGQMSVAVLIGQRLIGTKNFRK